MDLKRSVWESENPAEVIHFAFELAEYFHDAVDSLPCAFLGPPRAILLRQLLAERAKTASSFQVLQAQTRLSQILTISRRGKNLAQTSALGKIFVLLRDVGDPTMALEPDSDEVSPGQPLAQFWPFKAVMIAS